MDNFAATTKGLRSCDADLKVTVGRTSTITSDNMIDNMIDTMNERSNNSNKVVCFMYPKAILANASEYVDTMLSIPMKEKETCTISFSDIRPERWLKWTNFVLDPVCACKMDPFDADVIDMFLFYDKYQFRSGIHLFDYKLSLAITSTDDIGQVGHICRKVIFDMVAMISNDTAVDLPLTKDVLQFFITRQFILKFLDCSKLSGDEIRTFLPYVFKDYNRSLTTHLEEMADIVDGAKINVRSVEELKLIFFDPSFASTLKTKLLGNKQLDYVLKNLTVDQIFIEVRGLVTVFRGYYDVSRRPDKRLGVMQNCYSRHCSTGNVGFRCVVQSMDGLGSTWTISASASSVMGTATLLYKWHKGDNITSILPPIDGWEDMGGAISIFDDELVLAHELDNPDDDDDDDENTGPLVIQYT